MAILLNRYSILGIYPEGFAIWFPAKAKDDRQLDMFEELRL